MTARIKAAPTVRAGDIAVVTNTVLGAALFSIKSVETDSAGVVTAYYLSTPGSRQPARYESGLVVAVIANMLNTQE